MMFYYSFLPQRMMIDILEQQLWRHDRPQSKTQVDVKCAYSIMLLFL